MTEVAFQYFLQLIAPCRQANLLPIESQSCHLGIIWNRFSGWIAKGVARYERLFSDRPPTAYAPFAERVPIVRGRWDPDASTATSYAWFVWHKG
jgi:hypothetical protein